MTAPVARHNGACRKRFPPSSIARPAVSQQLNMLERIAARALQAGARASSLFAHRGYSIGCRLVSSVVPAREIVVRLNPDALFAFPLGDGYWSLLLDRSYQYEPELNFFLRSVTEVDYTFVDGGANFGLWSVLVSSPEFGRHPVVAIEASAANAARLRRNASLNADRFPVLHRALSNRSGVQAWMGGRKHEARQLRRSRRKRNRSGGNARPRRSARPAAGRRQPPLRGEARRRRRRDRCHRRRPPAARRRHRHHLRGARRRPPPHGLALHPRARRSAAPSCSTRPAAASNA